MIGVGLIGFFLILVLEIFLNVIEIDGYLIEFKRVDEIIIYFVECYDFEFDFLYVNDGLYNVIVYILEGKFFKKRNDIIGCGLIKVKIFIFLVKMILNNISKIVLNCFFDFFFYDFYIKCILVIILKL